MKMIEEVAAEYFDKGFNCAESALLALADYFKINSTLVPAVASGFGGGIGPLWRGLWRSKRRCY